MMYHYFLIAWRNIIRKRTLSFIQVFCLSVGLAAFFLAARYVQYEKDFDKFNEHYASIYRAQSYKVNDRIDDWSQIPAPVGDYLLNNFPEVECALLFREVWFELLSPNGYTVYKEHGGCWASSSIFDMFSFQLVQGDKKIVLDAPNSIVLSQSLAAKYFPGQNAMGQVIYDVNKNELLVTGIMEDLPEQSHIQADYFRSNASILSDYGQNWTNNSFITYVQLKPRVSAEVFSEKIADILLQHAPDSHRLLYLNPLSNLHLKERPLDDRGVVIYFFSVMGILILLLTCVSFMNLTTAFSSLRQVEIGVRKSIGSSRRSIIIQFLSEAVTIAIVSFILAVFMVYMLLPVFNTVVERNITLHLFINYRFTLFLIGIVLITGLLAGAYPAFIVSNFKPVTALKRSYVVGKKKLTGLQVMVYFQFVLSVVLITVSLWMYRQVNHIGNKDLGFVKEQLLRCSLPNQNSTVSYQSLRNEILSHPGIDNMSMSINSPIHSNWGCYVIPEGWDSENAVFARWNAACPDYLNTMGFTMVDGQMLSSDLASNKQACVINETAVRAFGWDNPIGKEIEKEGAYTVVGVIKDFIIEDVHNPISPYVLLLVDDDLSNAVDLTFKVKLHAMADGKEHINRVLHTHFKDVLFEVDHYDANLKRLELMIWNSAKNTILFFTIMAVIIAAMGLFGLIYYASQRRVKEIGIRKVQGARAWEIMPLIVKKYVIIAIAANIIVYPLSQFIRASMPGQYKYQFSAIDLILILAISILITLVASLYQVIKAINRNPVEALRYE